jgi:hypothetical protein
MLRDVEAHKQFTSACSAHDPIRARIVYTDTVIISNGLYAVITVFNLFPTAVMPS